MALGFRVNQEKWDEQDSHVTRVWFDNPMRTEVIYLDLGLCHLDPAARWSKVTMCGGDDWKLSAQITRAHSCSEHHIDSWNAVSKVFSHSTSGVDRSVRLYFTPCKMSLGPPKLVVHIELLGRAYEAMLRENDMANAFPPLDSPQKSTQSARPRHTPVSASRPCTPPPSAPRLYTPLESTASMSLTRQHGPCP